MLKSNDELRKIILKNPGLPVITLVSNEVGNDDYQYTVANIECERRLVLDVPDNPLLIQGKIYTDEDDLENDICDALYDDKTKNLSDEEYDRMVQKKMEELEPYWRQCIVIWVTN